MNKTLKISVGVIVGIVFLALAIFYWTVPSGSLPSYMPGFIAGGTTVHVKHGIAAFVVALLGFIYAWFASAKKAQ